MTKIAIQPITAALKILEATPKTEWTKTQVKWEKWAKAQVVLYKKEQATKQAKPVELYDVKITQPLYRNTKQNNFRPII